ncbi:MAG: zinc ABC transporter substrate-binding protein [candidate division Zixibacteria bacterium]|nr:zinc ABC transporter substrate-binding protein [candidate division Zixibacteria bacterium]
MRQPGRWHIRAILAALFIGGMIAGCGQSDDASSSEDGKLEVVATTGMIADAVKNIAGETVSIHGLMGPGVDPHLYKATKGDIDRLNSADIIFYNGLNLEAKMAEIFRQMGSSKTTVPIGDVIPDSLRRHPAQFEGHPDPHIWFDVSLWETAVQQVAMTLIDRDSARMDLYCQNASAYLDSLDALHQWVKEQIAQIPENQRVLVTAHDAFGYFGRAYGVEVEGLQGISTVTEAGLYDVTHMIDLLVERKIKAVFVESSVPRKSIEAVVEGCRSRGHEIVIGGELFSDAMGQAGTPEGTYLGMVRHNVNAIVKALK